MNKISFIFSEKNSRFIGKDGYTPFGWIPVTVVGDKVSIKGLVGNHINACSAHRYSVKMQINEIIKNKDWTNECVREFKEESVSDVSKIVDAIRSKTVDVKEQYIQLCDEYALRTHASAVARLEQPKVKEPARPEGYYGTHSQYVAYTTTPEYKAYEADRAQRDKAYAIASKELVKYRAEEKAHGLACYESATVKLADRVHKMGMSLATMSLERGKVDHAGNLAVTITDGDQKLTAWTIVAQGPIVRPHYRYLIK